MRSTKINSVAWNQIREFVSTSMCRGEELALTAEECNRFNALLGDMAAMAGELEGLKQNAMERFRNR